MDYYKILNEDETHHELKYQTGLNIDIQKFNPSGDCKPGGIYFSREDILAFLGYGPWIRKVTIPEDAQVYENPGNPKKWKADKVILEERERINVKVIRRLINEGSDPKANDSYALRWSSENGYLEIVKLLLEAGANPKANNSYALQLAARNGHLEIVKLLLEEGADPKANDSYALQWASENGHLEIVKLLLEAGTNPKAGNSLALQVAAENGHLDIVKLLLEVGADPKAGNSLALRWASREKHLDIIKLLLPVSEINESVREYIRTYCKDQEIKDMILNYI
jgi:ankyrin repeat protein